MTTIDDCLDRLRPMFGAGDTDDRTAACEVMSEFVAGHPGQNERCAAMLALEGALTREAAALSNASLAFAFGLIEWLDRERRGLEEQA